MKNIKRLFGTDVFSYETLDVSLANRGLLLIEGENRDLGGSNGSGKSNLFKTLCWVLFGKAPQNGETISADDVIREDDNHEPIVGRTYGFVEIEAEEVQLQVFRHRKHAKYGNKVLLYADGNDVTMGSDRETQGRIEDYLGIDYDSFVYSVMFPQDMKGFANLTDAKQKAILDKVLGTERFNRARDKAKKQLGPLVESFSKLQGSLTALHQSLESQQARLADIDRQETEWLQQLHQQIEEKKAHQKQLEDSPPAAAPEDEDLAARKKTYEDASAHQFDIATLRQRREELLQKHAAGKARLEQYESVVEPPKWSEEIPEQAEPNDGLLQRISQLGTQGGALSGQIDQLERIQSERESTTECTQCGQELSDDAKDFMFGNVGEKLKQLQEQLTKIDAELDEAKKEFAENKVKAETWERYRAHVQEFQAHAQAEKIAEVERSQLEEIERDGLDVKRKITSREDYDEIVAKLQVIGQAQQQWQDAITQIQLQIRHLNEQTSPYGDLRRTAQQQIGQTQRKLMSSQRVSDQLDQQISILRFWEDGFGPKGVRSLLLDHITPELNRVANEYLDTLSSGMARMEFHTTKSLKGGERRDNFHVEVKYTNGGGDYKKISGGERQRPDLASMFALGDLAASRSRSPIALRLLDEPFDGLDGLGAEQVVQVLRNQVLPRAGTVLVMTHDDNLKSLIDDRLVVVKENGVSWVQA
jgi:DNA repair exonuclease SbcCD ATPase subunit